MVIENPISGEVVATWPKISVEERLDVLQRQLPALDAYTTYKFLSEAERDAFWDDGPNSAITTDAKLLNRWAFWSIRKYVIISSPALHSSLLFHSNSIRKSSFTIYKQGKDVIFSFGKTWCPDIRFSAIRMEAMTLREILGDSKVPEVKLQACCVPWLTGCHGR